MALYNEMRSRDFSELKGQNRAVTVLQSVLRENRIPNAFLLIGAKGTGKTSVARIFARAVNCEHPTEKGPCNKCQSCREILAGTSMDVMEMDAASNNSVDDVHELIKAAQYVPLHKKKVFIMDEFHMLSQAAFNAMLKTIEEPNENCLFIFCTTEEHKVPATIKSRCMRIPFDRIDDAVVYEHLKYVCELPAYNIPYEEDALKLIARKAGGSMRDALSMLDPFLNGESIQAETVAEQLGASQEETLFTVLQGIGDGDISMALSALHDTIKHGGDIKAFLQELMQACIDLIYAEDEKLDGIVCTQLYRAYLETTSGTFSRERLLHMVDELAKVYGNAKYTNIEFAAETTIISLIASETAISKMEKEIQILKSEVQELKERGVAPVQEAAEAADSHSDAGCEAGTEAFLPETSEEDWPPADEPETLEENDLWKEAGKEALGFDFPRQEEPLQESGSGMEKPEDSDDEAIAEGTGQIPFQTEEKDQQQIPEEALPVGAVIGNGIQIDMDTKETMEQEAEKDNKVAMETSEMKGEEALEAEEEEKDFFFDFFKASLARP